jgi:phosphoglycolate phosphatase
MPFKAVLFDLDGTLLDTLEDIAHAANRVLTANGFPGHGLDAYRRFVGNGAATLMTRALPAGERREATIQRCLDGFLDDYGRNWNVKTAPYPGISDLLDALTARGTPMAVLSNKPHPSTCRCVQQILGRWRFEVIFGERPGVPRKPDPAGALEAAGRMALPPSAFLYLGDTATDMATAEAAGMYPVGVAWGFRPAGELERAGARLVVQNPPEVVALLEGA